MISKHPEEFSFLVDVNLPKRFDFFNNENFTHVVDINPRMSDDEIWKYAIENNKIILTKDTDFYSRAISSSIAPKVIWFQLGNMTLKKLHQYFKLNWEIVLSHLTEGKLIIAQKEQINVIY